jgi:hypothetical protein
MDELVKSVSEVFGPFLHENGFVQTCALSVDSGEHLVFVNSAMKIRFSLGVHDRIEEVTVTLGETTAPDSDGMWHPLAYAHSPSDPWMHVGDFIPPMTDEEYDAWVLAEFQKNGPTVIKAPSLHSELVRYLREVEKYIRPINARFRADLRSSP